MSIQDAATGGGASPLPHDRSELYLSSDSPGLTLELRSALRAVEKSVALMNEALRHAMEAGVTVELRRRHRLHSGDGNWSDQMAPLVHAVRVTTR